MVGDSVLNVSVHLPSGETFYWVTIATGTVQMTAENHIQVLEPILVELTDHRLDKINAFSTDTCDTMRLWARLIKDHASLRGAFTVLCDSHGLQLLVKDLLKLPLLGETLDQAMVLINGMKSSKLQLARFRQCQRDVYSTLKALISRLIASNTPRNFC